MKEEVTKSFIDDLTYKVTGAAIAVHSAIGPGMLESLYHKCLIIELRQRGISFESERKIEINYSGEKVDTELRCDLIVEDCLIVELKSVLEIKPIFKAQVLSYMNLLECPKGILFNFTCFNLQRDGRHTLVNQLYEELDD